MGGGSSKRLVGELEEQGKPRSMPLIKQLRHDVDDAPTPTIIRAWSVGAMLKKGTSDPRLAQKKHANLLPEKPANQRLETMGSRGILEGMPTVEFTGAGDRYERRKKMQHMVELEATLKLKLARLDDLVERIRKARAELGTDPDAALDVFSPLFLDRLDFSEAQCTWGSFESVVTNKQTVQLERQVGTVIKRSSILTAEARRLEKLVAEQVASRAPSVPKHEDDKDKEAEPGEEGGQGGGDDEIQPEAPTTPRNATPTHSTTPTHTPTHRPQYTQGRHSPAMRSLKGSLPPVSGGGSRRASHSSSEITRSASTSLAPSMLSGDFEMNDHPGRGLTRRPRGIDRGGWTPRSGEMRGTD